MGVGDPLEAAYPIATAFTLDAADWHLVGDGLILASVDMQFDVLLREGGTDHPIATFTHHFDVPSGSQGQDAVPLDADAAGLAAEAHAGDLLVLRMTATRAPPGPAYLPNADGPHTNGRIPSLTLP